MIHWIEGIALAAGLGLAMLVALFPRIGAGSQQLLFLIGPAGFSAAAQAFRITVTRLSEQDSFEISFALIIFGVGEEYLAWCLFSRQAKRLHTILAGSA